jgi:hypothetical protein
VVKNGAAEGTKTMKTTFGKNLKITVATHHREALQDILENVLGAEHASPRPNLDTFKFGDGFNIGFFFVPAKEALDEGAMRLAPWLELLVDDPDAAARAVVERGAGRVEYEDKNHPYVQLPGGLTLRFARGAA